MYVIPSPQPELSAYTVNAAQKMHFLECWKSASLAKVSKSYEKRHFIIGEWDETQLWQTQEEDKERKNPLSLDSSLCHL